MSRQLLAWLVLANLLAWAAAFLCFGHHPILLGTALLAYSFGLRHAADADHIAAIDNVTRKLMQEGKRPIATGLYFSLGHSTVVAALSAAIALTAIAVKTRFAELASFGNIAGTLISAGFLFALAAMNLLTLRAIWNMFRHVKSGGPYIEDELSPLLAQRGFLARIFRSLFGLVKQSWHMYPIGILFGLGFDTATEVGLLGIAAAEASKNMNLWTIMIFPALFTAGMSLVDTADGIMMLNAYGWAFLKPLRKLYYNLTITAISVAVALLVGSIEILGLLQSELNPPGSFWSSIATVNTHFGLLGYAIIALFTLSWTASLIFYRLKNYDAIEITTAK
jgi:high-affinity nickel-transport protein